MFATEFRIAFFGQDQSGFALAIGNKKLDVGEDVPALYLALGIGAGGEGLKKGFYFLRLVLQGTFDLVDERSFAFESDKFVIDFLLAFKQFIVLPKRFPSSDERLATFFDGGGIFG